jgi:small-conductance mechanosensitive channel
MVPPVTDPGVHVARTTALLANASDAVEELEEVRETATGLYDALISSLPRLGVAIVIVLFGWLLGRLVRMVLRRRFTQTRSPSFAAVMSRVGGIVTIIVATLVAITVTFPSVQPVDVLASLGFFSVAVGFAFQDILENTLAGILLLFRQPFQGGDQIDLAGQRGTVEGITIRETRLRTFDGELLIVPNAEVYKNRILVQTAYPEKRWSFVVGVSYDDDLDTARNAAIEAVNSVPEVLAAPPPRALLVELGASTVNIEVQFWTGSRQGDGLATRDHVIDAVKAAMDAAEVSMPSDIVELAATRSFAAALRAGDREG